MNWRKSLPWKWLLLSVWLAAAVGCPARPGDAPSPIAARHGGEYPFRIVATTGMVADLVRQVAGERAIVVGLMGEGVDPHLYKPTRNDVKQLLEADVVFYNGLMLEGRMGDAFSKVARSGKPVYAVTEGIDEALLLEPPEFDGHWDPHVWMDVSAWSACAEFVAEALAEYDPAQADEYRQRAAAYRTELAALDDYVRTTIATVPAERRVLATAHDAFNYFSRAYEIDVLSAQGVTTESEAGVDDINHLVDELVRRQIPAIFVETSVSAKNLQAVLEGCRQRGWPVEIGGELFSDALGPADQYEGTYLGMIDHNATAIVRALGGEAPAGGRLGKLQTSGK